MKSIFIALFFVFSNAYTQELSDIQFEHHQRLESIEVKKLNPYEKLIALALDKFSKGSLNNRLINYLAVNESYILKFKKASEFARINSKDLCGVKSQNDFKAFFRHTDDEIDAMRHLLWSGYLTLYFDEKTALELTSLQEDRQNNPYPSMLMDLWNNYFAIDTIGKHKKDILKLPKSQRIQKVDDLIKDLYERGQAKVINSTPSQCTLPNIYPNFKL